MSTPQPSAEIIRMLQLTNARGSLELWRENENMSVEYTVYWVTNEGALLLTILGTDRLPTAKQLTLLLFKTLTELETWS